MIDCDPLLLIKCIKINNGVISSCNWLCHL